MERATRYSPKRQAILECICSTDCHPSAEWVYAMLKPQIPDLSLATVYRNLARFREDGVVLAVWKRGWSGALRRRHCAALPFHLPRMR